MQSVYSTAPADWTINECIRHKTEPSEDEAQKLWEMWSISSLPLLPGLHWPVVVVPLKVPFIVQKELFVSELFNYSIVWKQMTNSELLMLHSDTWNYLTVCNKKQTICLINIWNNFIVWKQMTNIKKIISVR